MATIASIRAEKLAIKKGSDQILSELTFTVSAGSITGLVGPSGAGKTTLMRAIVGVQQVTQGNLEVLGKVAGDKVLRRKIGYVTQAPAIYNDLTVIQNLRYFGVLTGATNIQIDEIIHKVKLDSKRKQLTASLSGGEKARVSLAVALLGDPGLLVLDEPTVGLDPILRQELWQLFAELAAQGKTLLISSHVMDEAEKCQSLLLLRDGRLLWQDSRESLLKTTHTKSVEEAFVQMVTHQEVA
ncbi:MAG: Nod factor export ATP-binding protein [Candidatus Saccharibacteria bacterium]|nr:Nod factor export ATP-binding protein [Candidatus Saccharibacteria bacterium]